MTPARGSDRWPTEPRRVLLWSYRWCDYRRLVEFESHGGTTAGLCCISRGGPHVQRILVVDDDPAITSVLKRGLSYEGFAVTTASSGVEGLSVARDDPPDLVILDVLMPGLDGLTVLGRLRAADRHLPVLLLTA